MLLPKPDFDSFIDCLIHWFVHLYSALHHNTIAFISAVHGTTSEQRICTIQVSWICQISLSNFHHLHNNPRRFLMSMRNWRWSTGLSLWGVNRMNQMNHIVRFTSKVSNILEWNWSAVEMSTRPPDTARGVFCYRADSWLCPKSQWSVRERWVEWLSKWNSITTLQSEWQRARPCRLGAKNSFLITFSSSRWQNRSSSVVK